MARVCVGSVCAYTAGVKPALLRREARVCSVHGLWALGDIKMLEGGRVESACEGVCVGNVARYVRGVCVWKVCANVCAWSMCA